MQHIKNIIKKEYWNLSIQEKINKLKNNLKYYENMRYKNNKW